MLPETPGLIQQRAFPVSDEERRLMEALDGEMRRRVAEDNHRDYVLNGGNVGGRQAE